MNEPVLHVLPNPATYPMWTGVVETYVGTYSTYPADVEFRAVSSDVACPYCGRAMDRVSLGSGAVVRVFHEDEKPYLQAHIIPPSHEVIDCAACMQTFTMPRAEAA